MRINEIQLNNIGPYLGEHIFNLSTTDDKPLILIGGKNGAGKTTLLKSIKIGLFGCFAYGYKTENQTYFCEVEKLLSKYTKTNDYGISIKLEYIEKRVRYEYVIKRKWRTDNGEIIESIQIVRNGDELDSLEGLEFVNKLRSLTSPALINSFIFDGEKIGNVIENGEISSYIKSVFNSIFGIDLLNQFQEDLTTYLNSDLSVSLSDDEYELTAYLNQINACKAELKNEKDHLQSVKSKISDIRTRIDAFQKEFMTLGGVSKKDISKYEQNAKSLENETEKNNRELRVFYEDYLPFCIVSDELKNISKQANRELPIIYAEMLSTIQSYLKVDFSSYILKLNANDSRAIYCMAEEDIASLNNLIKLLAEKRRRALQILLNKSDLINSLMNIRKTLENNLSITRLDEIIVQISKLSAELSILLNEEIETDSKINELESRREYLLHRYDELLAKSKKEKSLGNSYILCTNTLKVCEELKEYIKENKLAKVSQTCCNLFNETLRKDHYISDIKLDKDFCLHLYMDNKAVDVSFLSAGETQILISCIIWAMFKISGRREMFVFDTPLARLDEDNRSGFIRKIISTISGQVVILSTDSEFVDMNYTLIEDKVARNYLLSYNDNLKTTSIQSKYFGV